MKSIYNSKLQNQIRLFCVAFLLLIFIVPTLAQTDTIEKKSTKMKMSYQKINDNSKNLVCELSAKIEKKKVFIKELPVTFFYSGDSLIKLGTVNSDNKGTATLTIPSGLKLVPDKDGFYKFTAKYEGNNVFEEASEEVKVKDAEIEIVLTEDSLKSVTVNANEIAGIEKKPLEGTTVTLYVKRSLGLLKIKDQTFAAGTVTFDFPKDIPGDKDGNLTIVARIEDDENFGNIEKSVVKNWGIPLAIETAQHPRELWSPDAPLWMSITLFILILAVVIHYMVIFYKLYRINKEGKNVT